MKDLLIIQSLDLVSLMEEYRLFFLGLLPSIFLLAVLVEYFDRMDPFILIKRALISVLILTSVSEIYFRSIDLSMEAADNILRSQQGKNILLLDFFEGVNEWEKIKYSKKDYFKNKGHLAGALSFLKFHLFDSFINDGFTIAIFFLTKICFLILKVVYSLVYYLGYGLLGIPCLIYLFPSMGNVLRGGIISFIWCLIIPHILVFILTLIGSEINKGYLTGEIIGGSMMGTALLFILTLFVAFTPLIGMKILTGAGLSSAGGMIATLGANYVMNIPRSVSSSSISYLAGGGMGPKMKLATNTLGGGYKLASNAGKGVVIKFGEKNRNKGGNIKEERIKDVNHISSTVKGFRESASKNNIERSRTGLSKIKFSLNEGIVKESIEKRGINAKLSKYGRVNKESKETNGSYFSSRGDRKLNNSHNRRLFKQSRENKKV